MTHPLHERIKLATQYYEAGQISAAETLCLEILDVNPDQEEALYLLSRLMVHTGLLEMGLDLVQRAVVLAPREGRYLQLLAEIQRAIADPRALQSACKVTLYDPGDPQGYLLVAKILAAQGRWMESLAQSHFALSFVSDQDLDSGLDLKVAEEIRAQALEQLGAVSLSQILDQIETLAQEYFVLGKQQEQRSQVSQALANYQLALLLKPDLAVAADGVGKLLMSDGYREEALAYHRRALFFQPDSREFLFNLGVGYERNGDLDAAQTCYQNAFSQAPTHPLLQISLANLEVQRGHRSQALQLLTPLIAQEPLPVEVAIAYAGVCSDVTDRQKAVTLLQRCLDYSDLSKDRLQNLLFALGNLQDKLGDYHQAFFAYQRANALHSGSRRFDPEQYRQWIDRIIAIFTPEFLSRLPPADQPSEIPIFIVGMPRSGTSLVEQILATHPQVFGGGELKKMGQLVSVLPDGLSFPDGVKSLDLSLVNSLSQTYLEFLISLDPKAKRITDKAPLNFLYLGLIQSLYPQGRVIHCRRDPRDTCLSCFFQTFDQHPYKYDLSHLGSFYRGYWRLMQHWQQVLSLPILDVQYEILVHQPEAVIRSLLSFCGLDWDPNCLLFHQNRRLTRTASRDQVTHPIYTSSIGRHHYYHQHLGPLYDSLGDLG